MTVVLKKADRSPFSDYSAYVSTLKRLAVESHRVDWNARVDAALNGQASAELRRIAPVETRRKLGAFFYRNKPWLTIDRMRHGIQSERTFSTTRPAEWVICLSRQPENFHLVRRCPTLCDGGDTNSREPTCIVSSSTGREHA